MSNILKTKDGLAEKSTGKRIESPIDVDIINYSKIVELGIDIEKDKTVRCLAECIIDKEKAMEKIANKIYSLSQLKDYNKRDVYGDVFKYFEQQGIIRILQPLFYHYDPWNVT